MQEETGEIVEFYNEGTLGALLNVYDIRSTIRIYNECQEQLVDWSYYKNLLSIKKGLNPEMLARRVLTIGADDSAVVIMIEGVEDVE